MIVKATAVIVEGRSDEWEISNPQDVYINSDYVASIHFHSKDVCLVQLSVERCFYVKESAESLVEKLWGSL